MLRLVRVALCCLHRWDRRACSHTWAIPTWTRQVTQFVLLACGSVPFYSRSSSDAHNNQNTQQPQAQIMDLIMDLPCRQRKSQVPTRSFTDKTILGNRYQAMAFSQTSLGRATSGNQSQAPWIPILRMVASPSRSCIVEP